MIWELLSWQFNRNRTAVQLTVRGLNPIDIVNRLSSSHFCKASCSRKLWLIQIVLENIDPFLFIHCDIMNRSLNHGLDYTFRGGFLNLLVRFPADSKIIGPTKNKIIDTIFFLPPASYLPTDTTSSNPTQKIKWPLEIFLFYRSPDSSKMAGDKHEDLKIK